MVSNEIFVADIRNKLTPIKTYITLADNKSFKKEFIDRCKKEAEEALNDVLEILNEMVKN